MTLEEAIRTAIEFEVNVRNVYRDAVRKIADEGGRKVLQTLAAEEQDHVDYLTERLREWKDAGQIKVTAIPRSLPSPETIQRGIETLQEKITAPAGQVADRESDLRMLERALEVEKRTSAFYERMVRELPPESRGMFERFLEIEKGHLAIVEAEIDSVSGMGFWFGFPEFDLENE
ncbi:MAG TPA: ferritin family protein [bacterium]|nr:ferritin family protein [bacterium]